MESINKQHLLNESTTVDLSKYDNAWYQPGASHIKRMFWYFINAFIFNTALFPFSGMKCTILRLFGATVGINNNIKPLVRIKYPWNLKMGDNVWLGEGVWIDNLTNITIGNNVCLSQEAYLLTGNHDYSDRQFGLIVKAIVIEDGAWIGARAIVCPGVTVARNAIVTVNSVLQQHAKDNGIYRGNPAEYIKKRTIT